MNDELFILWTNDNIVTTEKMVCMYAHNAIKECWWHRVTIIVWGATAQLLAHDNNIQNLFIKMMSDGVTVSACKACSDQLGVSSKLENLGVEVKYWGEPLTYILKNDQNLITI